MEELLDAYRRCFDFKGRTSSSSCGRIFFKNTAIAYCVLFILAALKAPLLFAVACILFAMPIPALAVRRLNSAGKSPLVLLYGAVPAFGPLALAYFLSLRDAIETDNAERKKK